MTSSDMHVFKSCWELATLKKLLAMTYVPFLPWFISSKEASMVCLLIKLVSASGFELCFSVVTKLLVGVN